MAAPQQTDKDDFTSVAVIGILLLITLAVLWWFFGSQIKYALLLAGYYMLYPIYWVVSHVSGLFSQNYIDTLQSIAFHISKAEPNEEPMWAIAKIYGFIGRFYWFFLLPVVGYVCLYMWRYPVTLSYRATMDLDDLIARNVKLYPQIRPAFVDGRDLLNENVDHGPFARALDYRSFAEKHKLLLNSEHQVTPWRDWHSDIDDPSTYNCGDSGDPRKPRIPVPYPAPYLDIEAARNALAKQLGKPWEDYQQLPEAKRALFGIIAARVARDKDAADKAMFEMNASWDENIAKGTYTVKCDLGLKLADKYHNHPVVKTLENVHSFENTYLPSLFELAKSRAGIFASADFLWMKVVDRTLWYALNQVGRRVAFPEGTGTRAHLIAERALVKARQNMGEHGRPEAPLLPKPVVEAGIRGLAHHLVKEGYLSQEWAYTQRAKKAPNH